MADVRECLRIKNLHDNNIKFHRDRLEVAVLDSTVLEKDKREFKLLIEELQQFQDELNEKFGNFRVYIDRNYHEISTTVYVLNIEERGAHY